MKKLLVLVAAIVLSAGYVLLARGGEVETSDQPVVNSRLAQEFETKELVNLRAAPQIINMTLDQIEGQTYELNVEVANILFTPDSVGAEHQDNQGHGRIHIDDQPVAWLHNASPVELMLEKGSRHVKVTLNTNDFRDYAIDGQIVSAELHVEAGVDDHVQLFDDDILQHRLEAPHTH